ncbi:hypothetical protein [Nitrincola nitratireducens]|uniref:Uncharacterized protein n=1 Tax=Nitrincola nitratireducens TaxID=1229521 RepID=W9V337_9GAMM|nr:hypothetical protein [Nitrincola nitratireducens]EXJ10567.1 hypothetical protein D791_02398 [Nitrincola nitratireducens]
MNTRILTLAALVCVCLQSVLVFQLPIGFYQQRFWLLLLALAVMACVYLMQRLANITSSRSAGAKFSQLLVPALFGFMVLMLWEAIVRGFNVPLVLMPAPSRIMSTLLNNLPTCGLIFSKPI